MPWARLDDGYFTNGKVVGLSKDAKLLDLAAITFSARELRNGILTRADIRVIAAQIDVEAPFELIHELVRAGRWEMSGQQYVIHDYLDYNPTREQVIAARENNAERQARWRERQALSDNGTSNAVSVARVTPAPYPYPEPVPKELTPTAATQQAPTAAAAVAPMHFDPGERETIDKTSSILAPIGLNSDPRFWRKVLNTYGHVDLEAEAIKIADWQQRHRKRQCSQRFVLNWLGRAGTARAEPNGVRPYSDRKGNVDDEPSHWPTGVQP